MKKKCLITGGAGFIGCSLSHKVSTQFDRIIVFDNLHPQIHKKHERPKELENRVELVEGDITNSSDWDKVLYKFCPDTVIHLAAETGTGQSLTESTRHASTNVVGTTQMLDAFVRNNTFPSEVLLTSSRAIYGEGIWKRINDGALFYPGQRSDQQLKEGIWDFPGAEHLAFSAQKNCPRPTSVYGATKLAQENILSSWASSFNVPYKIVRLQNVYGPGQSLVNSYTGIVSLFVQIAKAGNSIPLYEDGQMLRDFVFIDDVTDAIIRVLDNDIAIGQIFDIGSGISSTIAQVASIISNRYHSPDPHICGKYRNGDIRHASCDCTPILSSLGWKAKWNLNDGLKQLCDWIDNEMEKRE